MSIMLTVWEDTDFSANEYRCALDIYLMTVLSSLYGLIMDRSIRTPGHGKNVVYGIDATNKHYLKDQIQLIGR